MNERWHKQPQRDGRYQYLSKAQRTSIHYSTTMLVMAVILAVISISVSGTPLNFGAPTASAQASCMDDIIQNGSFEVNKNGWLEDDADSDRSTTYAVDGSYYLWIRPAGAGLVGRVYQEIPGITAGASLELSFFAGSHRPDSYVHEGFIEFYNQSGTLIATSSKTDIDFDVEDAPPVLEQYSVQATAPAGTSFVRVVFSLDGDYIKLDNVSMKKCDPLGSIGDTVWSDPNDDGNGTIDNDDFPIKNVVVRLLDSNGDLVTTDTTDDNGAYLFTDLPLGTYTVEIDTSTLPDVKQGNPAYDPEGNDDNKSQVTLTVDNPNDRDRDFAYFQTLGSIGDTIWSDPDNDGNNQIDGDDFPIKDVVVRLLNSDGNVIDTKMTNSNGKYRFTQLPLNQTYTVQVDPSTLPDVKQGNPAYDPDGGNDNESEVTLTVDSPNDLNQDFAYFQTLGSIGDTIWSDVDNDGNNQIDGGDFPIKNVVVRLLDIDGNVIDTDTTDSNGKYLFENLPLNETYRVVVDTSTLPDVKQGNPAYDPDGGNDSQSQVTLTLDNPNNLAQDFAYFQTLGSIGDTVWSDVDDDGNNLIDGDDFPIKDVVVTLLDSDGNTIDTAITNDDGKYLFTQLPLNETYTVRIDTSTLPDVKQGNPAYDPDGGDDNESEVTLTVDNPNDRNQDFAYYQSLGSIGDTVWSDVDDDGNGMVDGDDFVISGVEVILLDSGGSEVARDTTDENGKYLFTQLPLNETYTVRINTSTLPDVKQGNSAYDPDGGDNNESEVTLTVDNPNDRNQDFAYYQSLGSIGDTVWSDVDDDGNGMVDGDDFVISGVEVILLDSNGSEIARDTTDENGKYLFTQLPLNETYTVRINTSTLPDVKQVNPAYDPDGGDDNESEVTLTVDNPNDRDQDFAYYQTLGSIGDTVWSDPDSDGNSTIDGDDFPIAGVVVNLLDSDGNLITTDTTDESGNYLFEGLRLNQAYTVQIDTTTLPDVKQGNPSYDPDGGDDSESTITLTLENPNDRNQDFAYYQTATPVPTPTSTPTTAVTATPVPPTPTPTMTQVPVVELASLGDKVWKDLNGNGQQDGSEPGVSGVVVNLYNESGGAPDQFLGTMTTSGLGMYSFVDLDPSQNYIVEFILPTGMQFTSQDMGDDASDSDADPSTGWSHVVELEPGEDDPTIDAGIVDMPTPTPEAAAALGNRIWKDTNKNGIQDSGETSVDGVTVNLWVADENGMPIAQVDSAVTANGGQYLFTGLMAGQPYVVQVDTSTIPDGCAGLTMQDAGDTPTSDASDSDMNPATGISGPVVLEPGETNTSVDAGLVPATTSIGNRVWKDANSNGIQDEGEAGVPGVPVTLWSDDDGNGTPDTSLQTIETDASGVYLFTDLDPSKTYIVQFGQMPTMPYTEQDQGTDEESDSDVDPTSGITDPITVEPGENKTDIDAGMLDLPAALGDIVWKDTNSNGIQDAGEAGVPGVNVTLWSDDDGNGTPDTSLITVQTDDKGNYLFTNLDSHKSYIVQVEAPADCVITLPDQGSGENADGLDSDIDPNSGISAPIELEAGEINTSVDAGLAPSTAALGNTVWKDANQNGIQDEGELGIGFVTVNLWTDDDGDSLPDTKLTSVQTTPLGQYLFTDLDPSLDYIVQVETPNNCAIGPMDQGRDDAMDSDIDPDTGISAPIQLDAGETDTTVDIGLIPSTATASLGNYVWLDENANGLQDEGEVGVEGVIVTLLNSAGEALGTQTTGADGMYSFENLEPGLYSVQFELPSSTYFFTSQDLVDEALDSDVDPATGQTAVTELTENENDPKWDAGIISPPALDVQKTASSDVIQQGELIDFNIVYSNAGLSAAKGVVITELVPQYTTFEPDRSTPGWVCEDGNVEAGSVCTFAIASVPGQSTNTTELHFVVQVDKVVENTVTSLRNQIQIVDDGSHPSGFTGQGIDEVLVVVRHPTALGEVNEGELGTSRSFLYLPLVRRNLFKEQPSTLLSPGEWTAVWACGVATNPQLQWDANMAEWATAVCAAVGE